MASSGEVLILLRSDHNQAFSSVLAQAIRDRNLQVSVRLAPERPTDHDSGRILLAFMRLATGTEESLSWRTLIELRNNGIGNKTIERLHEIADQQHRNFYAILQMVKRSPDILRWSGKRVAVGVASIETALNEVGKPPDLAKYRQLLSGLRGLARLFSLTWRSRSGSRASYGDASRALTAQVFPAFSACSRCRTRRLNKRLIPTR